MLSHVGTSAGIVNLVIYQCIQVQGGLEYEFGGDLRVPAGQPSGTAAYVFVEPFSNDHCAGVPATILSAGGALTGNWSSVSRSFEAAASTRSFRVALGLSKPVGETEDAQAYFDNIYLLVPDSEGVVVLPAMSASWFNPAEAGHGIMIHLLNANTAWMCWFTFDLEGNPVWICALGVIDGDTITFDEAFTVEGGAFPPNFDPEQIEEVPWGSIVVVFTGCDTGTMSWITSAAGFQSGQMPIVRLTDLWGVPCSED